MEKTGRIIKIEISHRTIIFGFLFFIFLKFLWEVKDLLFSLVIAFIIMSALKPLVKGLMRIKIPRLISTIIVYCLFLASFIYLLIFILPPILREIVSLAMVLPGVIVNIWPDLRSYINFNSLFQLAPNLTDNLFKAVSSFFGNVVFFISTLFFGFYFLMDESFIRTILIRFFSEKKTESVASIFDQVEKRLSYWFWGELALMFSVGLLSYIGFNLIGLKYALPLAVLAGLLEIVPNLGPTISAIPAIIIGLSNSLFLGLAALAVSFIVQQLENNLIVPLIMNKATGFNPIIILISLIIGGKIGGVLGLLLSLPILIILETIFEKLIKTS